MVRGLRFAVYVLGFMTRGLWFAVYGWRFMAGGLWLAVHGSLFMVGGVWLAVYGSRFIVYCLRFRVCYSARGNESPLVSAVEALRFKDCG